MKYCSVDFPRVLAVYIGFIVSYLQFLYELGQSYHSDILSTKLFEQRVD